MNEFPSRPGPPSPGPARSPASYPSKDISHVHKPTRTHSYSAVSVTRRVARVHCFARCLHTSCVGDGAGQGGASWSLSATEQTTVWTRRALVSPPPQQAPRRPPYRQCSASTPVPMSCCTCAGTAYDKVSRVRLVGERFHAFVSTTDIAKSPSTKTADRHSQARWKAAADLLANAAFGNVPIPARATGGTGTSVLSLHFFIRSKAGHLFISSGPWTFPVLCTFVYFNSFFLPFFFA